MGQRNGAEFRKVASEQSDVSFFRELWDFLRQTQKWWLLPILVVLLLFAALLLLSLTPAAPFIYTLF
jgi:hypothetical protein